jgi:hypothetical protein
MHTRTFAPVLSCLTLNFACCTACSVLNYVLLFPQVLTSTHEEVVDKCELLDQHLMESTQLLEEREAMLQDLQAEKAVRRFAGCVCSIRSSNSCCCQGCSNHSSLKGSNALCTKQQAAALLRLCGSVYCGCLLGSTQGVACLGLRCGAALGGMCHPPEPPKLALYSYSSFERLLL